MADAWTTASMLLYIAWVWEKCRGGVMGAVGKRVFCMGGDGKG